MIDLLFIALVQTVAGDPEAATTDPARAQQEATTSADQVQTATQQSAEERRRCRIRQTTGTRLQSVVTCRRGARQGYQDQNTRDALHDLQRPAPTSGN